ncbi:hypothetical protein C8Q78DRAFT_410896 [Trametes maxima]|nr:hypothetical protein C8Q78DRAFT_410896 [Trametes maxima]
MVSTSCPRPRRFPRFPRFPRLLNPRSAFGLSSCGDSCVSQAESGTSCNLNDLSCLCRISGFLNSAIKCISDTCGASEVRPDEEIISQKCQDALVGSAPGSSTTSTEDTPTASSTTIPSTPHSNTPPATTTPISPTQSVSTVSQASSSPDSVNSTEAPTDTSTPPIGPSPSPSSTPDTPLSGTDTLAHLSSTFSASETSRSSLITTTSTDLHTGSGSPTPTGSLPSASSPMPSGASPTIAPSSQDSPHGTPKPVVVTLSVTLVLVGLFAFILVCCVCKKRRRRRALARYRVQAYGGMPTTRTRTESEGGTNAKKTESEGLSGWETRRASVSSHPSTTRSDSESLRQSELADAVLVISSAEDDSNDNRATVATSSNAGGSDGGLSLALLAYPVGQTDVRVTEATALRDISEGSAPRRSPTESHPRSGSAGENEKPSPRTRQQRPARAAQPAVSELSGGSPPTPESQRHVGFAAWRMGFAEEDHDEAPPPYEPRRSPEGSR